MKIRFSRTTKQFYPLDIQYPDIPDDIQEVDISLFEEAMARPAGSSFDIVDGALVITAAATPIFSELATAYLDTVRATRETILNRLAGIGMAALVGADTATATAVATARTALLNITTDTTVLAATDLPGLKAAVLSIYKAIVAAAPAGLVKAFDGMDA